MPNAMGMRSSPISSQDLRNEIHDVKRLGRIITWGTSTNVNTDWKLAVELAGQALWKVNPSLLIFVAGQCFSFDLRAMYANRPKLPDGSKLVWTVSFPPSARSLLSTG